LEKKKTGVQRPQEQVFDNQSSSTDGKEKAVLEREGDADKLVMSSRLEE
jgi:hypothetical protein